jgi:hypothetical protein
MATALPLPLPPPALTTLLLALLPLTSNSSLTCRLTIDDGCFLLDDDVDVFILLVVASSQMSFSRQFESIIRFYHLSYILTLSISLSIYLSVSILAPTRRFSLFRL